MDLFGAKHRRAEREALWAEGEAADRAASDAALAEGNRIRLKQQLAAAQREQVVLALIAQAEHHETEAESLLKEGPGGGALSKAQVHATLAVAYRLAGQQ